MPGGEGLPSRANTRRGTSWNGAPSPPRRDPRGSRRSASGFTRDGSPATVRPTRTSRAKAANRRNRRRRRNSDARTAASACLSSTPSGPVRRSPKSCGGRPADRIRSACPSHDEARDARIGPSRSKRTAVLGVLRRTRTMRAIDAHDAFLSVEWGLRPGPPPREFHSETAPEPGNPRRLHAAARH